MPGKGPIPNGRWSWNFDSCQRCQTTERKHKGNGLCTSCHDKRRDHDARRKAVKRQAHLRYWDKVKNDPEDKRKRADDATRYRRGSKAYRAYLNRYYARSRFVRFLTVRHRFKHMEGGCLIRCECPHQTVIQTPFKLGAGVHNMNIITDLRKWLRKKCTAQECYAAKVRRLDRERRAVVSYTASPAKSMQGGC
jgi:uncharacterized Zn finger protein (UPF0148 family)